MAGAPIEGELVSAVALTPNSEVRVRIATVGERAVLDVRVFWRSRGEMEASHNAVTVDAAKAAELLEGIKAAVKRLSKRRDSCSSTRNAERAGRVAVAHTPNFYPKEKETAT